MSGARRFSAGTPCSSASAAMPSRAFARRSAAAGSRSAHARGVGGPSVRGAPGGQVVLGHVGGPLDRLDPSLGVPLGATPMEAVGGEQRRAGRRHRGGGRDDRTVADDAARRHVPLAGELVARLPEARTAPRSRRPRTRWSPDVRRQGSLRVAGVKLAQRVELLARPLVLAGLHQLRREDVAQLDQHLDVEGGVVQPRGRQRARRPVGGGVTSGSTSTRSRCSSRSTS